MPHMSHARPPGGAGPVTRSRVTPGGQPRAGPDVIAVAAGGRGRPTARPAAGACPSRARRSWRIWAACSCVCAAWNASQRSSGYAPSSLWVPDRAQSARAQPVEELGGRRVRRAHGVEGGLDRARRVPQALPVDLLVERRKERRVLREEPPQADRARQLGVLEMVDHVPDAPGLRARPPVELGGREPGGRRQERPVARPVPRDQLDPLTLCQRRPPRRPSRALSRPGLTSGSSAPPGAGRVSAAGPPSPPGCSGSARRGRGHARRRCEATPRRSTDRSPCACRPGASRRPSWSRGAAPWSPGPPRTRGGPAPTGAPGSGSAGRTRPRRSPG